MQNKTVLDTPMILNTSMCIMIRKSLIAILHKLDHINYMLKHVTLIHHVEFFSISIDRFHIIILLIFG